MKTAGILLAAGASRRFGPDDKLLAILRGKPLVTHAAAVLRGFAPDFLIGVVRAPEVANVLDGFDIVYPDEADPGQADSLRAGVLAAQSMQADRILVVLGDMPLIIEELLKEVAIRCRLDRPSAATDGKRASPPACFPRGLFPDLLKISGDRGAAGLLSALPEDALIFAPEKVLFDVDNEERLLKLNKSS